MDETGNDLENQIETPEYWDYLNMALQAKVGLGSIDFALVVADEPSSGSTPKSSPSSF